MISLFLARLGNHLPSGARHDVYAYRFHQLERCLDESTLADQGYIGFGLLTPIKRKASVRMRAAVRQNNRQITRLRSVVERIIAQIKTWRVFSLVRALIFFVAGYPYE